ncbi:MAG: putative N-formylglutamate amidohydrolase [Rhodobacteraceae bacterium HLUCCA12]|nr:MAG: putative N-formylglutamate amidohydrolase [Rhodobacteraceae bacterium HLUCCA12]
MNQTAFALPDAAEASMPVFPGIVETFGDDAGGGPAGLVLICEHASNTLPDDRPDLGGDLGLDVAARQAHVAWDIGALGLSRALARRLAGACGGVVLVHAPLSRLVFDLNRAPDHPGAMSERSEAFDIPGNRGLNAAQRLARTRALYLPFHETLRAEIAALVARGRRPALIAVHSFTPVFHGAPRAVEFGVIHDDDTTLTDAVMDAAPGCGLATRLNEPYSAEGEVTHTIRLHATPLRLQNTMLEIRNDLIATPSGQDAVADRIAPVLQQALHTVGAI